MRVDIQFGVKSSPGETGRTGGGRMVNAIAEQLETGEVLRKRAPGLRRFITPAGAQRHTRGLIAGNSGTLLAVYDGRVEAITYSGGVAYATDLGVLIGTDLVTLARNNASPPHVVCVSSEGVFLLTTGGAPTVYPDGDVGSPNSVCFLDGYFFFTYGDGSCIASGVNATSIDVTHSIKAESKSKGLLRGVAHRGQLFLFGPSSIEVWQDTANPTGFPFSRATIIERGLVAPHAVAGWEDDFTASLLWVGSDNIVYLLQGYQPFRVSTHDVEQAIQDLADKSSLRAFVFMNAGHAFWVLKSDQWCWVYDLLTSSWHERKSYGSETWRGEQACFMWGDWVIGDEDTGYLFRPDDHYFLEDESPLIWEVESLPSKTFPNRLSISRADFNFVAGQGRAAGAPQEQAPSVRVSWSNDGGASYSLPVVRELGQQGAYGLRVTVLRPGRTGSYGRKWRLSVSDAVYVGLLGGSMDVQNGSP